MKRNIFAVALIVGAISLHSCQKLDSELNNANLEASLTGTLSEITSTEVANNSSVDIQSCMVEKYDGSGPAQYIGPIPGGFPGHGNGFGFGRYSVPHIDPCATVSVSSDTFPKTITIDYGVACADKKGHIKQGKIIITLTDTAIAAGAVKTIVYQDFYIDSIKVEYTATVKNLGLNEVGNWVIESKSTQTITKNGDVSTQINDETIEWVSGFATTDKTDDIFYKTGSGNITVNDSLTFERNITKPLLYDRNCRFILSGTVEIYRKGITSVIDYGEGECDSIGTITVNGITEEINLNAREYRKGGHFEKHCPNGKFGNGHHGEPGGKGGRK